MGGERTRPLLTHITLVEAVVASAEGADLTGELQMATRAVAALERQVGSSASAAGAASRQVYAELVTLAVKAAVVLRKAVPDAAACDCSLEGVTAIAAALEASGSLLSAAPHLKSCAGTFLILYVLLIANSTQKNTGGKRFRCRDSNPGRPGESRIS